jgi:hypothetical protein
MKCFSAGWDTLDLSIKILVNTDICPNHYTSGKGGGVCWYETKRTGIKGQTITRNVVHVRVASKHKLAASSISINTESLSPLY